MMCEDLFLIDPLHYIATLKTVIYESKTLVQNLSRGISYFINIILSFRCRVSSGSMVSDYGLDDRAIGVRYPAGAKDFSCILCVQTGSEAHPASCTMGNGGPFPGGKSAAGV
jgi:hypothetical protein